MAQTYTKEKIDELIAGAEGTEVIANPTLAGTESALTGLQVGDTKYKIESGGGKLYVHRVKLAAGNLDDAISFTATIINGQSSPFSSTSELISYLESKGHIGSFTNSYRFVEGIFFPTQKSTSAEPNRVYFTQIDNTSNGGLWVSNNFLYATYSVFSLYFSLNNNTINGSTVPVSSRVNKVCDFVSDYVYEL